MPACCHGTAAIAVEVSDAMASPAPIPTSTRPGMTTGQLEFSRRTAWRSAPTPMTSSPVPTIQRGDVRCRNRPTCPDTMKAEAEDRLEPERLVGHARPGGRGQQGAGEEHRAECRVAQQFQVEHRGRVPPL